MTWLDCLTRQPAATRLGWTLLHFLWQGSAAAALTAAALWALRRRSANARYLIACAGIGLMAIAPVVTFALVDAPAPQPAVAAAHEAPATAPMIVEPVAMEPAGSGEDTAPPQTPIIMRTGAPPEMRGAAAGGLVRRLRPALPYLVAGWLVGVVMLSIRLLLGWIQAQRVRRCQVCPVAPRWREKLRELAGRLGIRRPVRLMQSGLARVPTVIGHLRPVLLLPASALTGLAPAQLEAVLVHELAHIRRWDYLANLLQRVVEVLLFYHPAVWWVSGRIRREREHCCDDLAAASCGDRFVYARALLAMAEIGQAGPRLAVAADGGRLPDRIRRIAGLPPSETCWSTRWLAGLAALVVVCLAVAGMYAGTVLARPRAWPEGEGRLGSVEQVAASEAAGGGTTGPVRPQQETLEPSGRRPKGNCRLSGQVLSAGTGRPIDQATVDLLYLDTVQKLTVRVASDGSFAFKDIPSSEYVFLTATARGYQRANYNPNQQDEPLPRFRLQPGEQRAGIVFRLKPAYRITGRVVGADGRPPANAKDLLAAAWSDQTGQPHAIARFAMPRKPVEVQPDGSYEIDGLDSRPAYVMVFASSAHETDAPQPPCYYPGTFSRREAWPVEFTDGRVAQHVNIQLRRSGGLVLEGVVTDKQAGQPIPRALLVVHHRDMLFDNVTAYTDEGGRYRIDALGPGELSVHADATPDGYVRARQEFRLESGSQPKRIDFALRRGVKIAGRFVGTDGEAFEIQPGRSYGSARVVDAPPPEPAVSYGIAAFRNRYGRKDLGLQRSLFFSGDGEYSMADMVFSTRSAFVIEGLMPGQTSFRFQPSIRGVKVLKVLHRGKDYLRGVLETAPGQVIEGVTIVLGRDRPGEVPKRAAAPARL